MERWWCCKGAGPNHFPSIFKTVSHTHKNRFKIKLHIVHLLCQYIPKFLYRRICVLKKTTLCVSNEVLFIQMTEILEYYLSLWWFITMIQVLHTFKPSGGGGGGRGLLNSVRNKLFKISNIYFNRYFSRILQNIFLLMFCKTDFS